MYTWEQDFISDDWAYAKDGKPLMWVRPDNRSGRDGWAIFDLDDNQIGGTEATLNGAMSRAVSACKARPL